MSTVTELQNQRAALIAAERARVEAAAQPQRDLEALDRQIAEARAAERREAWDRAVQHYNGLITVNADAERDLRKAIRGISAGETTPELYASLQRCTATYQAAESYAETAIAAALQGVEQRAAAPRMTGNEMPNVATINPNIRLQAGKEFAALSPQLPPGTPARVVFEDVIAHEGNEQHRRWLAHLYSYHFMDGQPVGFPPSYDPRVEAERHTTSRRRARFMPDMAAW